MKIVAKIALAAASITLCAATMNAQEYQTKHDFSIGWGAGTNSEIINMFEDVISVASLATFGSKYKTDNEESIGAISLEYTFHANKVISVGAIAAYGARQCDITIDGTPEGKMKSNYYTLMPAVKFDWLRRGHFGMYSKVAAGVTLRTEKNSNLDYDESKAHFNWQASLLGLEAGGSKVRGFTELGTGEQGILLLGIRFKF